MRGLRVTELPLTVLESAVELRDGAALTDRALQRHTTLPVLVAVHERNRGRTGARAAAQLLHSAGAGGHSEAERMLLQLLRSWGLTGWRPHVTSCGYEIDVAFTDARIAIEVDGWAWHRDVDRFNRDAKRQNVLVNAAGTSCGSPGTNSGAIPTGCAIRSWPRWRPADDRSGSTAPWPGADPARSDVRGVTNCTVATGRDGGRLAVSSPTTRGPALGLEARKGH
ncbi:endonuclease domain-containing protein [Rhodococcus sp. NPDC003318]|uniref:endonuclease domain-containing protein n=1 Tax=Rhodococcus sp. NPDC003318 TaxID=3364503 RepID=UPI0036BDF0BB